MVDEIDPQEIADEVVDESVIDDAVDTMYSMCGNQGQDSLISLGEDDFRSWAEDVLDGIGSGMDASPNDLIAKLEADLPRQGFRGTQEIWSAGMDMIYDAASEFVDEVMDMVEGLTEEAMAEALEEEMDDEQGDDEGGDEESEGSWEDSVFEEDAGFEIEELGMAAIEELGAEELLIDFAIAAVELL